MLPCDTETLYKFSRSFGVLFSLCLQIFIFKVFSMVRDAVAFPMLAVLSLMIEGPRPIAKSHIPLLVVLGLLGIAIGQLCYIYGVFLTSPNVASIFQPLKPIITSFLSMVFGLEAHGLNRFWGWIKVFGILIGVAGASLMVFMEGGLNESINWGILLLACQILCGTAYILIQKKYIFRVNPETGEKEHLYPPWTVTAYSYFFGSLAMAIAAIPNDLMRGHTFHDFNLETLISLSYAILVSSVICYGLVSYANALVSPSILTIFYPFQAVVTVIMSWIVLDIIPSWFDYVGTGLITIAVVLVCFSRWLEEREIDQKELDPIQKTELLKEDRIN